MARRAKHFRNRAGFHHAPRIHDRNPIRLARHHAKIMRDQHHRHAIGLTQIREQIKHLRLHRHIQRGGWFIGNQHARAERDCHRNQHALAHTA